MFAGQSWSRSAILSRHHLSVAARRYVGRTPGEPKQRRRRLGQNPRRSASTPAESIRLRLIAISVSAGLPNVLLLRRLRLHRSFD
jgi:hypothetical protein